MRVVSLNPVAHGVRVARKSDALGGLANFAADQAARRAQSDVHLHPKVQKIASDLPPAAVRLLDLVVKTDEQHRGACLIEVDKYEAAKALGVSPEAADEARTLLQRKKLIQLVDDGCGTSGWMPSFNRC